MNYADEYTEHKIQELEKKLKTEYAKSWKELNAKTKAYFLAFEQLDKEYKEKLDSGKILPPAGMTVKQHYAAWRKAQIGRGKRYEALRDDMAKRITAANKTAAAYVNDITPNVYAFNHNFSSFQIDKAVNKGLMKNSWTLVDENTVRELMTEKNHTDFRVLSINPKRDYAWNTKQINKCLTAGIMQGESMGDIANRFIRVMGNNQSAAIRNARTAVTSAQNAGRQKSYEHAEELGIEMWKEWMATLDDRTRDEHRELDGERVPYDETFSNGLEYPADPSGDPASVYNCRCTMTAFIPKYQSEYKRAMSYTGKNAEKAFEDWMDS